MTEQDRTISNNGELKRSISLSQFFSISFGAAIGVGWIMLMGDWLIKAGSLGAVIAFLIAGLAIGWVALGYLELATAFSQPGAEMTYAFEVLGAKIGFVVGWFLAAGYVAISAFESISIGWVISTIFPIPDGPVLHSVLDENVYAVRMIIGLLFLSLMGWLNYRGAVFVSSAQSLFVIFFITASLLFISSGLIRGDLANLQPLYGGESTTDAIVGIIKILAIAPFFILGFNLALQGIAERAPNVSLNALAMVIIISIIAIAVFYALVIVAAAMSAPREVILQADLPTAAAFRATLGDGILGQMVLVAGLFGLLTTWNAMLFAATRTIFELSVKGLIPRVFSRIHPKYGSPHIAALFTTVASLPGVVLSSAALSPIISAASMCAIFALFTTCVAVWLHRRNPEKPKPVFTMPGGKLGQVLVVVIGVALFVVSVGEPFASTPRLHLPLPWIIVIVWGLFGAVLWHVEHRQKSRKQPVIHSTRLD